MATHDYVISNASGAAVRADLNNALAAIVSNNSNATEPSTTYAYQWWADIGSSPTVMKLRNAANDGWITLFQLDGEWSTIALEDGTAAATSLYFKDSGTGTGIYSPGADQVAISTGGNGRLFIASDGKVGIKTSTPSGNLDVSGLSGTTIIRAVGADTNGNADAEIFSTGTTGNSRLYFSDTAAQSGSIIYSHSNNSFAFATAGSTALTIDSSQRVGVGTTPNASSIFQAKAATNSHVAIWDYSATPMILGLKDDGSSQSLRIAGFPLTFTGNGGGSSEAVRIDSSGRLLVGTSSDSGGALLQVNGNRVRIATAKTPASASDNGTTGEVCWDANYVYVCTAANTWKRSALSTW